MALRLYFNPGRFLENGKGALREVALLFSRLASLALGFGHLLSIENCKNDTVFARSIVSEWGLRNAHDLRNIGILQPT